jgi:hypothetical protein
VSSGRLEDLARRVARDDDTISRRTLVARGLLGVIGISGLGRLAWPADAEAAVPECLRRITRCLRNSDTVFDTLTYEVCFSRKSGWYDGVFFSQFSCWQEAVKRWREDNAECRERGCPPPKDRRKKSGKKPKPPAPPPLPPNPYDRIVSECQVCQQVGGLCCYSTGPTGLCACANPTLGCKRYGCH